MMPCGGGKNGSGSHANFGVATSHSVKNSPSANSHGARDCKPAPKRPSRVVSRMTPAITKAAIASSWVRDQSPRSSHTRQEKPKPAQARLANTPGTLSANDARSDGACPVRAAPSSTDCASSAVLDAAEYIDINPLRKLRRVGARLEHRYQFQIVGI